MRGFEAANGARHAGREVSGGGQRAIDAAVLLEIHRRRRRERRLLAEVERRRRSRRRPHDHEAAAADVAGRRMRHRQREGGGHRGIDRVATAREHRRAGIAGRRRRAHDDPRRRGSAQVHGRCRLERRTSAIKPASASDFFIVTQLTTVPVERHRNCKTQPEPTSLWGIRSVTVRQTIQVCRRFSRSVHGDLAGPAVPAGRDVRWGRNELFHFLGSRGARRTVPVRRGRQGNPRRSAGGHSAVLARLPAADPSGPALRLPRPRSLGARAGAVVQPAQAADGPLRESHGGDVDSGTRRSFPITSRSPRTRRTISTARRSARVRSSSTRTSTGATIVGPIRRGTRRSSTRPT